MDDPDRPEDREEPDMSGDERKPDEPDIMPPVDLAREVFAAGGDVHLLCCSQSGGSLVVSAAEVVYELSGQVGRVEGGRILFDVGDGERVEIDLENGAFTITRGDNVVSGRKALELLTLWRGMAIDEALAWLSRKYSQDKALAMGIEYVTMKVAGAEGSATPGT